jgi:hypothetical protein
MAEASQKAEQANKVPQQGDHDRVVMLSLKADGTADQHNPEIIGDPELAAEAARRQFSEQAVSAVDVAERGVYEGGSSVTLVGQKDGSVKEEPLRTGDLDPSIAALKEKHDAAAKAGESAADAAIKSLVKD